MGDVANLQEERLRKLQVQLEKAIAYQEIPDADFAELIYKIMSCGHISEQEFRDEFGLSLNAVQRWMTGKNLPQLNVRPVILRWVIVKLS